MNDYDRGFLDGENEGWMDGYLEGYEIGYTTAVDQEDTDE